MQTISITLSDGNVVTLDVPPPGEGFDILPSAEDSAQHIRQVAPGDHRRKLKPETIERLNVMFAPVLGRFGYSTAGAP